MKNRSIPAYIYELIDPDDGKTYYVGKSHQPHERFRQHLEDARDRLGTRKGMWLKSLVDRGRAPKLRIAKEVTHDEWREAEAQAIRDHVAKGSPLTNVQRPKGTRNSRPSVNMRGQDFWDDLTVQFPELKRRMHVVRGPEGLYLYCLWNLNEQGWRLQHVVHSPEDGTLLEPKTYGYNNHADLAASHNWWHEAVLARIFAPMLYPGSRPVDEALSDAEQGSTRQWGRPRKTRVRFIT